MLHAETQTEAATPRTIRVRKMDFPFKESDVPRWWFHDSPVVTHLANGLNILFPPGERFFIRSVKYYLDEIEDEDLRARVKAFFGQEGRHGHEHERANRIMESHGYDLSRFLDLYERVAFGMIEKRVPPVLRLSTTVALEHFTASLATTALTNEFIEGAHPVMRDLLRWHAAEEIEHKSVAFDVLKTVDPRYSVRIAGLILGASQLFTWWAIATTMLMSQENLSAEDKKRFREEAQRKRLQTQANDKVALFKSAVLSYLRPDFHPDDVDDYHLAREYLERVGAPV